MSRPPPLSSSPSPSASISSSYSTRATLAASLQNKPFDKPPAYSREMSFSVFKDNRCPPPTTNLPPTSVLHPPVYTTSTYATPLVHKVSHHIITLHSLLVIHAIAVIFVLRVVKTVKVFSFLSKPMNIFYLLCIPKFKFSLSV